MSSQHNKGYDLEYDQCLINIQSGHLEVIRQAALDIKKQGFRDMLVSSEIFTEVAENISERDPKYGHGNNFTAIVFKAYYKCEIGVLKPLVKELTEYISSQAKFIEFSVNASVGVENWRKAIEDSRFEVDELGL